MASSAVLKVSYWVIETICADESKMRMACNAEMTIINFFEKQQV
jgi:hypothetical protein